MNDLAPILQGYFTDRLARQKKASPNTVAAYRDTCKLLLTFAQEKTGKAPSKLSLADLDATLIGAFLQHLEDDRGNASATRNARLAAVHSLFRYAAPRAPEHAAIISQVLAIPPRRRERAIVSYLTPEETDALLAAPDRDTWHGRRDHALLLLAIQTGLRVSELTALACQDAHLGAGPHVRCHGKGRKDRATPLTSQVTRTLKTWTAELGPGTPLFPTRAGGRLSRDAVERLVAKHASAAAENCPSLKEKNVTPHTLRHTAAMTLLRAGVDTSVIALWLGHENAETTQVYLNSRELHQAGEKPQVSWWQNCRNGVPLVLMPALRPGKTRQRSRLMHDPLISWLASNGKVKIAATRGPGCLWLGAAPRAEVFSGFQYLTPPVHADMTIKEQALARVQQPGTKPGRYRPPDSLLAFLDNL